MLGACIPVPALGSETAMGCYDNMIPSPKFLCNTDDYFCHGTTISGDFENAVEIFKGYVKKAFDLDFTEGNDFILSLDESLDAGEYTILSTEGQVVMTAGASEGASYALASLVQVMQNYEGKALIANFEMHDKADNDYRGVMIDCARNVHPLPLLKKYVDLCWFYKIKYLHLHFTDDQAYTLPSKLFPKLTSTHNHYTGEEIRALVQYAHDRDIQIVPEIDTPGHSKALIRAYPEFCHTESKRILCFHEENIKALQDLYCELCDMFPYSDYIHIGADESSIMDWNECEECVNYGESLGIKAEEFEEHLPKLWHRAERFLVHYINKMAEAIVEKGRKPLVWEGFSREVNQYITRDVTVMIFESLYQIAPSYIKNGFRIINCSWRPTYVVTPAWFWGKDECYKWDVGTFSAIHPDSPYYDGFFRMESKKGIQGGQLNAWGDTLAQLENGLEDEYCKIREDLPAIAENTWNNTKRGDYRSFLSCHKHCERIFDNIIK